MGYEYHFVAGWGNTTFGATPSFFKQFFGEKCNCYNMFYDGIFFSIFFSLENRKEKANYCGSLPACLLRKEKCFFDRGGRVRPRASGLCFHQGVLLWFRNHFKRNEESLLLDCSRHHTERNTRKTNWRRAFENTIKVAFNECKISPSIWKKPRKKPGG